MTFLTDYMEAALAMATDPEEIALRQKVLDDHRALKAQLAEHELPVALDVADDQVIEHG